MFSYPIIKTELYLFEKKVSEILEGRENQYPRMINNFIKEISLMIKPVTDVYRKKNYEKFDGVSDYDELFMNFLILKRLKHPDIDVTYFPDANPDIAYDVVKSFSKICKMTDCNDKGTHRCSRCGWAKYCSVICQKSHWKTHKIDCCKIEK
jgi:hypothetical protein